MPRIVATYDYRDEHCQLLYQNVRFEPKDFRQRRPDGRGGWVWDLEGVRRVLYRLPELLTASKQDWILFVEGEKDAENLRNLGFTSTTSGNANSWRDEFAECFGGRLVCIISDNDSPGRKFAKTVADSLAGVAAEVRILDLPDVPNKGDISDWLDQHDSLEPRACRARIMAMIDEAKPVKAAASEQDLQPVYVFMRDVVAKPVQWLWRDRFPSAMLSLLVGIEGRGKTFVALDMVARVTTGRPWPDGGIPHDAPVVGNVVFLTSEDHLEYTIRPRLDAMKADPNKVIALKGVTSPRGDSYFDVMQHLPALETLVCEATPVRLIVVDPLTAFLGSTDQHKNGEVRNALTRFSTLAERYGCAVLGISHLSKDTSKQPIHRTLGSVAFSAAARAVWLVSDDKDDETRRLFVPVKMNLAPMAKSLAFRIRDMAVEWEAGQFDYSADEVLAVDGDREESGAMADACQWLRGTLADGRVLSTEVWAMAKKEKIAEKTLKRAKAKLGVKSEKDGIGANAPWYWRWR